MGVGSVVFASVPLVTFAAAVLHPLESFRWLTLGGGLLAIAGIAVMAGGAGTGAISLVGLLAMVMAVLCAAEAAIIAKRFPEGCNYSDPRLTSGITLPLPRRRHGVRSESRWRPQIGEPGISRRDSAWMA